MNAMERFGGDPAIGAWVNYGLGSVNDNLPGFVVLQSGPRGPRGMGGDGGMPPPGR